MPFRSLDEKGADDRGDDRHPPECERIEHRVHCGAFHQQSPEQHGGDHGNGIGLEEIGRHARAVADIIPHVIRDDGGIPGIIFRDPGLDLADQIRADIGALGEDAAAQAREDRDQGTAET